MYKTKLMEYTTNVTQLLNQILISVTDKIKQIIHKLYDHDDTII